MQRRLVALLLLAVFLGTGTTLPGPDALLHHWFDSAAEQQRGHVEPAGGCGGHAEQCTLGRTATGAGAVIVHAPVLRLDSDASLPQVSLPSLPVLAADRGPLPQPRAPPAQSV
jgi:hypothetical protein